MQAVQRQEQLLSEFNFVTFNQRRITWSIQRHHHYHDVHKFIIHLLPALSETVLRAGNGDWLIDKEWKYLDSMTRHWTCWNLWVWLVPWYALLPFHSVQSTHWLLSILASHLLNHLKMRARWMPASLPLAAICLFRPEVEHQTSCWQAEHQTFSRQNICLPRRRRGEEENLATKKVLKFKLNKLSRVLIGLRMT